MNLTEEMLCLPDGFVGIVVFTQDFSQTMKINKEILDIDQDFVIKKIRQMANGEYLTQEK